MTAQIFHEALVLTKKEGWFHNATPQRLVRPETLTDKQMQALTSSARAEYAEARKDWHARMPPIVTGPVTRLLEDLAPNLDANRQQGNRLKYSLVLDADAGLGKTTAGVMFGIQYHRAELARIGPLTKSGHEHIPVCFVQLTARTTPKSLAIMLAEFYGHPNPYRATAQQLHSVVQRYMTECHTGLLIIDDLHFINTDRGDVDGVSNHLKYLSNELNTTLLLIGIRLRSSRLLQGQSEVAAQTTGRWKCFSLSAFQATTNAHRAEWISLLNSVEKMLVLTRLIPGTLGGGLAEYLYVRTGGRIGSLMELIRVGAVLAIKSGVEDLSKELLERVTLDLRAEDGREDLEQMFAKGALAARPMRATDSSGPSKK